VVVLAVVTFFVDFVHESVPIFFVFLFPLKNSCSSPLSPLSLSPLSLFSTSLIVAHMLSVGHIFLFVTFFFDIQDAILVRKVLIILYDSKNVSCMVVDQLHIQREREREKERKRERKREREREKEKKKNTIIFL
jgi:hypothetical protein